MVSVIGHRGAAGVMPENTLKGFRYALDLGVDVVECDVHWTRDRQLVVIHDSTVDRTTGGCGAVGALTLARIRRLDAGDGETVPTLDEVLRLVRGKALLEVEMKGVGVEQATVAMVDAQGMADAVTFTSNDLARLARVRDLGRHYRLGAIFFDPSVFDLACAAKLDVAAIGVHYRNLSLRTLEEAHARGLAVRAWNPDTRQEQRAMLALGVDGVATNRPDLLIAELQRLENHHIEFDW
jgi:glycerophosphoryl diester phosphodiesterase